MGSKEYMRDLVGCDFGPVLVEVAAVRVPTAFEANLRLYMIRMYAIFPVVKYWLGVQGTELSGVDENTVIDSLLIPAVMRVLYDYVGAFTTKPVVIDVLP